MASTSGTSANHQRSLYFAIEEINEKTAFVFHKVTSGFCLKSSFSTLDLRLAAHTNNGIAHTNNGRAQMGLHVKDLFEVQEVEEMNSPPLEFIANSRSKIWPPFNPSTTKCKESDVMISLSLKVFAPLCSEVLLERSYSKFLPYPTMPELQVGDIGLGSVNTWHGTPDARIRGIGVVQRVDSGEEWALPEYDSEDEGSVGNSTLVEGKVRTMESNLAQAIGTCVVASFTAKTRHPEQKALVPTVLIDNKEFRVILYDCEKDVLLISVSKALAPKGTLSRSAMALLWLVINHRLFLQELPTTTNKYKSGIKSHLEEQGTLDNFTSLSDNHVNWRNCKQKISVDCSDLPVKFELFDPPPSKRRKV